MDIQMQHELEDVTAERDVWRHEAMAAREYIAKTHIPRPRMYNPDGTYWEEEGLYADYQNYMAARVPETKDPPHAQ